MAERTEESMCSNCLNNFHNPKVLDCLYTFRYICLENYIFKTSTDDHFLCPLCRCDTKVLDGGVQGFISKVSQDDVKHPEILKEEPVCETNILPCDVCKRGVNSEFRCKDCHQYLCPNCKSIHESLAGTRGHMVVDIKALTSEEISAVLSCEQFSSVLPSDEVLKDLSWEQVVGALSKETSGVLSVDVTTQTLLKDEIDFCSNHPQKAAKYDCQECLVAVCSRCFISDHRTHSFLDLQDDDTPKKRDELKTLTRELESQIDVIQDYADTLTKSITDVNNSTDTACQQVDKQVEEIVCKYRKLGKDIKDKIKNSGDEERKKLTKLLDDMKTLIADLSSFKESTAGDIANKSIVRVLHRIPEVEKKHIENNKRKLVIPDVSYPWFEPAVNNDITLQGKLGAVEVHHQSTFTTTFNLNDDKIQGEKYKDGDEFHIQGQPWCIGVTKETEEDRMLNGQPSLGVFLNLGSGLTTIESCRVKYTLQLMNIKNRSLCEEDTYRYTFTPGDGGYGWFGFINWERFSKKQNGFLDDDNNFTIKATVTVLKTLKDNKIRR